MPSFKFGRPASACYMGLPSGIHAGLHWHWRCSRTTSSHGTGNFKLAHRKINDGRFPRITVTTTGTKKFLLHWYLIFLLAMIFDDVLLVQSLSSWSRRTNKACLLSHHEMKLSLLLLAIGSVVVPSQNIAQQIQSFRLQSQRAAHWRTALLQDISSSSGVKT